MLGDSSENLLINKIFSVALQKKATDIHLMAGNYPVFRLDDKLFVLGEEKILTVETIGSLIDSFLTPTDKERLAVEKEIRTIYIWANRARFRAAVYYQQGYPAISFHYISDSVPTPQELHLPDVLINKITSRQGLILICGPFNSGRSSTVASLLQHVNTHYSKRIITLERPIEHVLVNNRSLVQQREIGKDTPSFAQGIRDIMEDDVDVVSVGECDEKGLPELILTLAESGRLVVATMDTNSAISALEKFLDGVQKEKRHWAKHALSSVLHAVINQRLVPAIGGGRVLVAEIVVMSPAVASVIQEENFPQLSNVIQTSRQEGMVGLDFRLSELVRSGKISLEDAKNFALDPGDIRS